MLKDASHLTSAEHVSVGLVPGFWPGGSQVRVVFCHVMGTEESPQDYTGPEGRAESKHNPQEVQAVVSVVKKKRNYLVVKMSVYSDQLMYEGADTRRYVAGSCS